jgi:hypothetical protein
VLSCLEDYNWFHTIAGEGDGKLNMYSNYLILPSPLVPGSRRQSHQISPRSQVAWSLLQWWQTLPKVGTSNHAAWSRCHPELYLVVAGMDYTGLPGMLQRNFNLQNITLGYSLPIQTYMYRPLTLHSWRHEATSQIFLRHTHILPKWQL